MSFLLAFAAVDFVAVEQGVEAVASIDGGLLVSVDCFGDEDCVFEGFGREEGLACAFEFLVEEGEVEFGAVMGDEPGALDEADEFGSDVVEERLIGDVLIGESVHVGGFGRDRSLWIDESIKAVWRLF